MHCIYLETFRIFFKLPKAIKYYRKAEQLDANVFSYLREAKHETSLAKPTLGGEFKEAQPQKQLDDIQVRDIKALSAY